MTTVDVDPAVEVCGRCFALLGACECVVPLALAEPGPARRVVLTAASTLTMKAPRWLWDRRIPAGAITLLAGREGIGKSTIAFDLVARTTRGTLTGLRYGKPAGVAVVATEDQWEEVILPRLVAARADMTRVYRVEAVTDELSETISAPADLPALRLAVVEHDVALLVLDPIMSVIQSSLDTHKDREVRQALDPLARFAGETGVAVIGLIHVNKSNATDPLNAIMGSRAFTAVTRSVLFCIADPECDTEDRFLFGHPKSNLGPKQPTLTYEIQQAGILLSELTGETIDTSRVIWHGEDKRSIGDVMEAPRTDRAAGELAASIEDFLRHPERILPCSLRDIAAQFPDTNAPTLRKNLARMVDRGTLTRPHAGHYALPAPVVTEVVTPLAIPSVVSQVSQVSLDQEVGDTSDGCDTVTGTGTGVTSPVTNYGPCAACSVPSERHADGMCFTCWTRGRKPA